VAPAAAGAPDAAAAAAAAAGGGDDGGGGGASSSGGTSVPQQQQPQGGGDVVSFRVVASKGASVRVLAHDLGRALGCGAHLLSLRREAIGGFSVDTAWALDVVLPLARKYAKGALRGPGVRA
jgi:hypothetical protein